VELAERVGPDFAYWLEAPFDLALWCWHQLRERDRVERWYARAARLEAAELQSLAHHTPGRLADERQSLYADARGRDARAADQQDAGRGKALVRRLRRAFARGS
jgi:hypothetical protein